MSGQDQEKVEAETAPKKGKERRPESGARVIGKLCGAGTALPTMAATYLVAVTAGVPGPTAVGRSLLAALLMWFFVSLSVRLLVGALLDDWKKAKRSRRRRPEISG